MKTRTDITGLVGVAIALVLAASLAFDVGAQGDKKETQEKEDKAAGNELITDFSKRGGKNAVTWGAFFNPGDGKAIERSARDKSKDKKRGQLLEIDYDVSGEDQYSGLWVKFKPPFDKDAVDKKTVIKFWVRGDKEKGYTERLKAEVKLPGHGVYACYVDDVTDEWQEVELEFDDFVQVADYDKKEKAEFVIVFENAHATEPNGTIYLDDVSIVVDGK